MEEKEGINEEELMNNIQMVMSMPLADNCCMMNINLLKQLLCAYEDYKRNSQVLYRLVQKMGETLAYKKAEEEDLEIINMDEAIREIIEDYLKDKGEVTTKWNQVHFILEYHFQ